METGDAGLSLIRSLDVPSDVGLGQRMGKKSGKDALSSSLILHKGPLEKKLPIARMNRIEPLPIFIFAHQAPSRE